MVFSKNDKDRLIHPGSPYPPTDEEYIREPEEYIKETSEPFGGVEVLQAKFARHERAAKLLYEARSTLREKYPDKWVSMDEDGVLTAADTHQELIDALTAKGLFSGDCPAAHLNTTPRRWTF